MNDRQQISTTEVGACQLSDISFIQLTCEMVPNFTSRLKQIKRAFDPQAETRESDNMWTVMGTCLVDTRGSVQSPIH